MSGHQNPPLFESAHARREELDLPIVNPTQDMPWLRQIGPPAELLTPTWFDKTNVPVEASKNPSASTSYNRQLSRASTMMFFLQLGWLDEAHPLHQNVVDGINAPSPATFRAFQIVHALRTMAGAGIDTSILLGRHIRYATYFPDVIQGKVAAFTDANLDGAAIINLYPRIFETDAQKIARQIQYIQRLARVFEWPHSVKELIETHPSILTTLPRKLAFLARVGADHLSQPLSVLQAFGTTMRPAESHLAAIALDDNYDVARALYHQKRIPAQERRTHALTLLQNKASRQKIGAKTIHAYLRYKPLTPDESTLSKSKV